MLINEISDTNKTLAIISELKLNVIDDYKEIDLILNLLLLTKSLSSSTIQNYKNYLIKALPVFTDEANGIINQPFEEPDQDIDDIKKTLARMNQSIELRRKKLDI